MKEIHKVLGPYTHTTGVLTGRAYYCIYYTDGSKTTILRSRYMMQEHLGRKLQKSEHVDHINGDHTDDRLENLQVLSAADHARKTVSDTRPPTEWYYFTCPECGVEAKKKARYVRHNRKQNKSGPFCSRSCAGKTAHR